MVQGPWDDPIMLPDPLSRIQRSGAAAPLLDAIRDRGARDAVRSAIERLTGAPPAKPAPPTEAAPALAGASAPAESAPPAAETVPASAEPTSDLPQTAR